MNGQTVPDSQAIDLDSLLREFAISHVATPKGKTHLESYASSRESARRNWDELQRASAAGEDVTDRVLARLLPHKNTRSNRDSGGWIHPAFTITKDVRKWFEATGWTTSADWPAVSAAIMSFVRKAVSGGDALETACREFAASRYSKGIQSAFLSPILSALRPDDYLIANGKSRRALRLLTGEPYRMQIESYPATNDALRQLLRRARPGLAPVENDGYLACDAFDVFCHWLVSVRQIGNVRRPGSRRRSVDRFDPAVASEVILALYSDSETRRRCLSAFADAIDLANQHGGMRWGVSLFPGQVRLNLGKFRAFGLRPDEVSIGLLSNALDRDTLESVLQRSRKVYEFVASPGAVQYRMPAGVYLELETKLDDAFQGFIRIAAATARRTPYAGYHSPGVIVALEQELGRALPQPSYAAHEGAPSAMAPAIAIQTPRTVFKKVDYDVAGLLNYVENGDIGLPDIQRPFVWSATKVRDLFDSMYRGFPVGYLLFWENSEIQGTKAIGLEGKTRKVPSLLIVDGQQRLTSLFAVMTGRPVLDDDFRETSLEIAFRPRDGRFEVSDAAIAMDPEFIPNISTLWSGKSSFLLVSEFLKSLEAKRTLRDADKEAISHNLDRLFDLRKYPFTALEIVPQVDEEAVADIFVRINSEGVSLRQADFILTLLSVFWDEGRRALEDFAVRARKPPSGQEPSPFNHLIRPSPSQLLRTSVAVAFGRARLKSVYQVLRGKDVDTGLFSAERRDEQFGLLQRAQASVLNLNHWHRFLGCLMTAGYRNAAMISSRTAVIYSYSLYLLGKLDCRVEDRALERLISRWFFMSSLTGRYTGSPETAMESDLSRLRGFTTSEPFIDALERIIANALTSDFWEITVPTELETSSTRNPAWLAYVAAQNRLGAAVLFSDKRISEVMDPSVRPGRKPLEAHHLFPRAWLQQNGFAEPRRINQVANLAHVEWPENSRIGATPPREYLPGLRGQFSEVRWERMSRDHALPPNWQDLGYLEFLELRRNRMALVVRRGFEALGERRDDDAEVDIADGTESERAVWTAIERLEGDVRRLIRTKFAAKWESRAESRIRQILGDDAWETIRRNREKYAKQYRTSSPAEGLDALDFCYLGQLFQLATAKEAWELFRAPFRDRRELDDLVRAIVPVRNDQAHFRAVPAKELERCRIAVDDLLNLLSRV